MLSRLSRVTSRLDSCVAMVGTWPAGPVAVIAWGQRSQYEGDSDPYRFIEWAHVPRSNRYHTVWYEAARSVAVRDRSLNGLDPACWPAVISQAGFPGLLWRILDNPARVIMRGPKIAA